MFDDLLTLPVKFTMFAFGSMCFLLCMLAVLFNYTNHSVRNSYEAYILGMAQYAQKNAGFNNEGATSFEEFEEALVRRHSAELPAEVMIQINIKQATTGSASGTASNTVSRYSKKIFDKDGGTSWVTCDKDGNSKSGDGAIGVRLQKGEEFVIYVTPYYRELNTFAEDLHSSSKQVTVNGTTYDSTFKGKTISIKDISHGYIKEDGVTTNNYTYINNLQGYTGNLTQ